MQQIAPQSPTSTIGALDAAFDFDPKTHMQFLVLDLTGDSKHIWDKGNTAEVEAAKLLFTTLKAKGFTAYHVTGDEAKKGSVMNTFDPNAERVIFAPRAVGG